MYRITKSDKTISNLDNKHPTQTIYIVGTGPSLRLFPIELLKNEITIGLNQAYKILPTKYSITVHPELIPYDPQTWNTTWITKGKLTSKGWLKHDKLGHKKLFYLFDNNNDPRDFGYVHQNHWYRLYVGRGIHTGAMHLAARMGAKYIILVGCDFCNLGQDHHATVQHIELHGLQAEAMYQEYYFYAVKLREILFQTHNVRVLSLTPFCGLANSNLDYNRQVKFHQLEKLPEPESLGTYERRDDIIRDFI